MILHQLDKRAAAQGRQSDNPQTVSSRELAEYHLRGQCNKAKGSEESNQGNTQLLLVISIPASFIAVKVLGVSVCES